MAIYIGERLVREHELNCEKGYLNDRGKFYNPVSHFPVALFDTHGYLVVYSGNELKVPPFQDSQRLNVTAPGISAHPHYVRCHGHRHFGMA